MSKIAFVFPGQGSQKVGMGASLCAEFEAARQTFETADRLLGFSLSDICFNGPEDVLKATENAQPALYVCSIAALRSLNTLCQVSPGATAGHSVGEYAALTAAEVLTFEDGVRLVRTRGELMRDTAKSAPGAMAAVLGLDADTARAACDEARAAGAGIVSVANFNGGGQIVISGETAAVERAGEIAREKGAKRVIPLPVSGGFHSPLMVSAGDALFASLSRTAFRKPSVPIVANVTARYIEMPDDVIGGLTMQVSRSVRWEESIQLLIADGFDTFIELGCGDVLCGLIRRIDRTIRTASGNDPESLRAVCRMIQETSV